MLDLVRIGFRWLDNQVEAMRFLRRLPTYFPNIKLYMMPLTEAETKQVTESGWLPKVAFRTSPQTNKIEIRTFLEAMYGMKVKDVRTVNHEGKKKRGRHGWYQRPAWKKAYVYFETTPDAVATTTKHS